MGRTPKLTPERSEEVCKYLRAGNYISTSCAAAGIGESTFYAWMKRGEEEKDGVYREFVESVSRARVEAEVRNVALVQRAATGDWRAAAWFLERSLPAKYGKSTKVEHSGPEGGPITLAGLAEMLDVDDDSG